MQVVVYDFSSEVEKCVPKILDKMASERMILLLLLRRTLCVQRTAPYGSKSTSLLFALHGMFTCMFVLHYLVTYIVFHYPVAACVFVLHYIVTLPVLHYLLVTYMFVHNFALLFISTFYLFFNHVNTELALNQSFVSTRTLGHV